MVGGADGNCGGRLLVAMPCAIILLAAACGTQPGASSHTSGGDVLVSVINVTPYEVSAVVSAILGDAVDTVERTVSPSGSAEITFVCPDELVVGDPLEPTAPGLTIDVDGQPEVVGAFSILAGESFACGDIVEVIVSGADPDTFVVDVFALTPP